MRVWFKRSHFAPNPLGLIFGILLGFYAGNQIMQQRTIHLKSHSANMLDVEAQPETTVRFSSKNSTAIQLHTRAMTTQVVPENESSVYSTTLSPNWFVGSQVRIVCWVMTMPANLVKAMIVKLTWGKRCDRLFFVSTVADDELPAIGIGGEESRSRLWEKTKAGFRFAFECCFDEGDWFMKADDDTFVQMDNLRYLLMNYNPKHPLYFGCHFKPHVHQGYMSGGAGYVISREALRRLMLYSASPFRETDMEDINFGMFMEAAEVRPGVSVDDAKLPRFFPLPLTYLTTPATRHEQRFWYHSYVKFPHPKGVKCCSETAITFHYIQPIALWYLEIILYRPIQPVKEQQSSLETENEFSP